VKLRDKEVDLEVDLLKRGSSRLEVDLLKRGSSRLEVDLLKRGSSRRQVHAIHFLCIVNEVREFIVFAFQRIRTIYLKFCNDRAFRNKAMLWLVNGCGSRFDLLRLLLHNWRCRELFEPKSQVCFPHILRLLLHNWWCRELFERKFQVCFPHILRLLLHNWWCRELFEPKSQVCFPHILNPLKHIFEFIVYFLAFTSLWLVVIIQIFGNVLFF
jgi:hypothetical protein